VIWELCTHLLVVRRSAAQRQRSTAAPTEEQQTLGPRCQLTQLALPPYDVPTLLFAASCAGAHHAGCQQHQWASTAGSGRGTQPLLPSRPATCPGSSHRLRQPVCALLLPDGARSGSQLVADEPARRRACLRLPLLASVPISLVLARQLMPSFGTCLLQAPHATMAAALQASGATSFSSPRPASQGDARSPPSACRCPRAAGWQAGHAARRPRTALAALLATNQAWCARKPRWTRHMSSSSPCRQAGGEAFSGLAPVGAGGVGKWCLCRTTRGFLPGDRQQMSTSVMRSR